MSHIDSANGAEHAVCSQLLLRGFRVYFAPRGQSAFDLVAEWPKTGTTSRIRVKHTTHRSVKWTAKNPPSVLPDFRKEADDDWTIIVDARRGPDDLGYFIVPSVVVENTIREAHAHYIAHPHARTGGERKDTSYRQLYLDGVDKPDNINKGFAAKWAGYLGQWDALK